MIQNNIKDDIQYQQLLLLEFEEMDKRYNQKNHEKKCRSKIPYEPPLYINNLKCFLTPSIVLNGQGLLDFWIPQIVESHCKRLDIEIIERKTNGNCFDWVKLVLNKMLKDKFENHYDFGAKEYQDLKTFYEIRNYQVHSGGYLYDNDTIVRLDREDGVSIDKSSGLININFSYCKRILCSIEQFLITIAKIV